MKQSTQYRIMGTVMMLCSSLSAFAQAQVETVQIDTLTKIIGIGLTLGGFFMGYMQMKMANKIAEQEAKFNTAMQDLKEKLEAKIILSTKEIELGMSKMATHHDINNMKQIMSMQHEITSEKMKGLEQQMKMAAELLRKNN